MKKKCGWLLIALFFPAWLYAQPADEAEYATVASVAFGSVPATYGTLLTPAHSIAMLDIVNKLQCDLYVSFNASTNHFLVPASSSLSLDYRKMGMKETSVVSIKYVANNCASGSVYASAVLQ